MTLSIWSSSVIDHGTHDQRAAAISNTDPLFGFSTTASASYNNTGDNTVNFFLTGSDLFGNFDETFTPIATFITNTAKLGTSAGMVLFGSPTPTASAVPGGAFWFAETAAGSNTYTLDFQPITYTPSAIPAAGAAVALTGSAFALASGISNINTFDYDFNTSTFAIGYDTIAPNAQTKNVYVQGFNSSGAALGSLVDIAPNLGLNALWSIRATSPSSDTFLVEDNSSALAAVNVKSFDPATGAVAALGSIHTSLSDITAFPQSLNLSNNLYAFAGTDSSGNSKIEFDTVDSSYNVTASHTINLSGTTTATRILSAALPNSSGGVFAYADPNNSSIHLVQVDPNSNVLDDVVVAQGTSVDRVRSLGDGRVEIEWRTTVSGAHNQENVAIYDTRTAGITTSGTSGNDWIAGTRFNDSIQAGDGNDRVAGNLGTNTLDGGSGDNTVLTNFKLADATLSFGSGGQVVLDSTNVHDVLTNFQHFQFTDGTVTRFTGSALVDNLYYDIANKDVFAAGQDPTSHYNQYGWHDGRNPNADFSTTGYLAANPDVAKAGVNPLAHYDANGWKEGRDPSANFDNELYLKNNPDVAQAGVDPLAHYLQYGQAEGRQAYAAIGTTASFTHGSFDPEYYLLSNPDVAKAALAAGGDTFAFAYNHYVNYGSHENRSPDAYFDPAYYLAHNPDVANAHLDPLAHYDQYGWKEGRDPSAAFHTNAYLAANPDIAAAHIDPLQHYLQYGADEGRHLS